MTDWADTIARECVGNGMGDSDVCRLFAEALRAEREANARVAEQITGRRRVLRSFADAAEIKPCPIAAAIRARGEDQT